MLATGEQSTQSIATVAADKVYGIAAWRVESKSSAADTTTVRIWLDQNTLRCTKLDTVSVVDGIPVTNPGFCPIGETTAPLVKYVFAKTEKISVGAGTFTARKYADAGSAYWIAPNVPLPVKISTGSGSVIMELESYT